MRLDAHILAFYRSLIKKSNWKLSKKSNLYTEILAQNLTL